MVPANLSRRVLLALAFPSLVLGDTSAVTTSIPRSSHRTGTNYRYPPWNPSPMIDENGFLLKMYRRVAGDWETEIKLPKKSRKTNSVELPAIIRQVPGDGNCLFHSISTCFAYVSGGTHIDLQNPDAIEWLYENSSKLRQQAVDCLEQKRKLLFLQGNEFLKSQELVEAAASQYGISGTEYCSLMRQDSYWGGGPEIVALCNVLQRPIHVYELHVQGNRFVLRRMACFGSPKYDRQQALHILSADSRFPDLMPGKQLAAGNHFLAMFPEEREMAQQSKQRLRGGDVYKVKDLIHPPNEMEIEEPRQRVKPIRWLKQMLERKRT